MDICQLPNILFLSACDILAIDKSLAPVTLVLAEDGTIVDDDDYFLCLPANTKFVVLAGNEKWTHNTGRKCWPYVQCTLHRDLLYCTRHLVALWLAVSTFMQQALLSTFCMPEWRWVGGWRLMRWGQVSSNSRTHSNYNTAGQRDLGHRWGQTAWSESQLCHLLVMWPRANYLTSQPLVEIVISVPVSSGCCKDART